MKSRSCLLSVVVLTSLFAESASPATFTGLGELPGGRSDSFATAISSDGRVVVGVSKSDSGHRLFRWTPEVGMEELEVALFRRRNWDANSHDAGKGSWPNEEVAAKTQQPSIM